MQEMKRALKIALVLFLCTQACGGVVVHERFDYKPPIRKISGWVVGHGNWNSGVHVTLFDKPELWSEQSLSFNEMRQKQRQIAATITDDNGRFEFHHIPKGTYEAEFSMDVSGGWNILSAFIIVDPSGAREHLCVQMGLEGSGPPATVRGCQKPPKTSA